MNESVFYSEKNQGKNKTVFIMNYKKLMLYGSIALFVVLTLAFAAHSGYTYSSGIFLD